MMFDGYRPELSMVSFELPLVNDGYSILNYYRVRLNLKYQLLPYSDVQLVLRLCASVHENDQHDLQVAKWEEE